MYSLLGLASFAKLAGRADDDWVDRLNHLYTVVILVLFAVFVTAGHYVGSPIECWTPPEFTYNYQMYAKSFCWLRNTYYIPMSESIPMEHVDRESEELTYYQWVPVILMLMAFFFKLPSIVWHKANGDSAINVDKMVNVISTTQLGPRARRLETITYIAEYVDSWLRSHQPNAHNVLARMWGRISKVFWFGGKRDGKYLTSLYMIVKLMYAANAMAQLFLLNAFIGSWYSMFGLEFFTRQSKDTPWQDSPRFPKVTLCDFDVRQLANVQRYTVQCVLPINLFNEKIFIFLSLWTLFTLVVTVGNLLCWVWRFYSSNDVAYVKKYLKFMGLLKTKEDGELAVKFTHKYLRRDGVFVLRMMARNANDILLSALIRELWRTYRLRQNRNPNPTASQAQGDDPERERMIPRDSPV